MKSREDRCRLLNAHHVQSVELQNLDWYSANRIASLSRRHTWMHVFIYSTSYRLSYEILFVYRVGYPATDRPRDDALSKLYEDLRRHLVPHDSGQTRDCVHILYAVHYTVCTQRYGTQLAEAGRQGVQKESQRFWQAWLTLRWAHMRRSMYLSFSHPYSNIR
jgi:hypothetical protein